MAQAFVQGTTGNGTTTPLNSTDFGSSVTTGNMIVVTIGDDGGAPGIVSNVTDTQGNTYTKILESSTTATLGMWYAKNVTGGASFHIIVTWNNVDAGRCSFSAQEFSGCDTTAPLDKSTSGTGTSTAPSSGNTAVLSQSNELVVGGVVHGGATSAISLGSGYTNLNTVNVANAAQAQESKVVVANTAVSATFAIVASRDWVCGVATFIPPGTPPVITGMPRRMQQGMGL